MLQKTLNFLQECKIFYLATSDADYLETLDGDQPRVRPFGLAIEHDGKLWFGTANTKKVYQELKLNPKFEISATSPAMEWIRLTGKAVFEPNADVKRKAFELLPMLSQIYKGPDDPVFEVFYIAEAKVVFQSMGKYAETPEVHRF